MQLAVSDSGTLAYLPGPTGSQTVRRLAIGDRSGNITGLPVPPAAFSHVRVSPDGTPRTLGVDDGKQASVLIYALSGTSAVQRLTSERKEPLPGVVPGRPVNSVPVGAWRRFRHLPAACRRHRRGGAADDPGGR